LPTYHKYRKNKNDFFVGRVERDVAPSVPSGEKFYNVVSYYDYIMFGFQFDKQKVSWLWCAYNWIKQSILWKLSYWKTNLLRYNLDVMHIEMNMFENISNMVMNV
jgi:hypothetical protein